MKIRFLGTHHEESKDTRLACFLIDDVLAVDSGSLASELTFSEQEKIKSIIVSHEHYDHIKGIPSFIFNNLNRKTKVFATPKTLKILSTHLFDGRIYPKFTEKTTFLEKPPLELVPLKPYQSANIEGYKIFVLPVNHSLGSIGFEITSKDGKKLFYSGDAGKNFTAIWKKITPHIIIIDTTFPNRLESTAIDSAHLTPNLLKNELIKFNKINGYFPKVVSIHLSPKYEKEISKEIEEVSNELKINIEIAMEGRTLII